jgi:hypothetical protein
MPPDQNPFEWSRRFSLESPPANPPSPPLHRRPLDRPAEPPQAPSGARTSPKSGWDVNTVLLVVLLAVVAGTAVIALRLYPPSHARRVWAAVACLAAGIGVGLGLARKRSWSLRLACLGAGAGLAVAAWWLVPTSRGLSLWSAHQEADRLLAQLKDLTPGDRAGYKGGYAARRSLIAQFPSFGPDNEAAENDWLGRSAAGWEKEYRRVPARDLGRFTKVSQAHQSFLSELAFQPVRRRLERAAAAWKDRSVMAWARDLEQVQPGRYTAFQALRAEYADLPADRRLEAAERAWLVRTCDRLKPGDFKGLARLRAVAGNSLQKEEGQWADRTARADVSAVIPLLTRDPAGASTRLQEAAKALAEFPSAGKILEPTRRQALTARFEATYRELSRLVLADRKRDRSREINEAVDSLATETAAEVKALGMEKTLASFRTRCTALSRLSRGFAPRPPAGKKPNK